MAKEYRLMPNESVILKEVSVAHGGIMASTTDELLLTNMNIICVDKGIFGNTKGFFQYPLSQIKKYNGKPQVMMGKRSNGTRALEVYFLNGEVEYFSFASGNKKKINQWVEAINKVVVGATVEQNPEADDNEYDDEDTLVGAFKEVGDEFKEIGSELLGAIGIQKKKKKNTKNQVQRVTQKCVSCSAPLAGVKGQVVKCSYCDTEQVL